MKGVMVVNRITTWRMSLGAILAAFLVATGMTAGAVPMTAVTVAQADDLVEIPISIEVLPYNGQYCQPVVKADELDPEWAGTFRLTADDTEPQEGEFDGVSELEVAYDARYGLGLHPEAYLGAVVEVPGVARGQAYLEAVDCQPEVNLPPEPKNQTVVADLSDDSVEVTFEATDPEGDTLEDWTVDQPTNGTVEPAEDFDSPHFVFYPETRGESVVDWSVSDGVNDPVSAEATFQVTETITPPEPSFDPETGLLTLPAVDGLVYHVDGEPRQDPYQVCGTSVVEVFGADQWVELNGTTSWTYAYECDDTDPVIVVTPTGPSVTQQPTCEDTSMVVEPSSQEGVVTTPTGPTTLAIGEDVTYTASPAEGYTFPEGVESEWSFINDFDDSQCDAPDPGPSVEFDRHPGENRYHTAALVSAEYSAETTRVAYVASGADQSMVDAIAGGPAAAAGLSPQVSGMATNQADVSAPVLLVRSGSVPGITHAALERFDNLETIVVLGGTKAISQNVTEELSQYGTVVRIAGDNRYETAALVAMLHGQSDRVYVASGADPSLSDALTAGALAGYQGHPVLLVRPNSVPQSFWTALAVLQPSEVVIVGGESAVSKVVSQEIGATDRLAGKDRYATAALVAAEFGPDISRAFIATGLRFPDALAGSALAARDGGPVLLTRLESAPGATLGVFNGLDQLQRVTTLGGLNAVSENVVDQVRAVVNP